MTQNDIVKYRKKQIVWTKSPKAKFFVFGKGLSFFEMKLGYMSAEILGISNIETKIGKLKVMSEFSRQWYELRFKVAFLEKKGNAFQDFFADIMEKKHPGDFQRIRPWGNTGDRKNDGYLRSQRMLFQVYAPNEVKKTQTLKKALKKNRRGFFRSCTPLERAF